MPFSEAVERAVDYCIHNGVLAEFLLKNRAEAVEMCIFEFDEEKYMKMERENAYEEGWKEGESQLLQLLQILIDADRKEDVQRILIEPDYRKQLYEQNNL